MLPGREIWIDVVLVREGGEERDGGPIEAVEPVEARGAPRSGSPVGRELEREASGAMDEGGGRRGNAVDRAAVRVEEDAAADEAGNGASTLDGPHDRVDAGS